MMNTVEKVSLSDTLTSSIAATNSQSCGVESIDSLRRSALKCFAEQGLPHRKNEEYKYSPVAHLFNSEKHIGAESAQTPYTKERMKDLGIPHLDAYSLVLVNGVFMPAISTLPATGIQFQVGNMISIGQNQPALFNTHFAQYADMKADPFIALNTAALKDILFVQIPDNTVLKKPIQIINISDSSLPALISPRILIHVGKNSAAEVIELFNCPANTEQLVCNTLTEVVVEEGAKVLLYKMQNNCSGLNLISTTQVFQHTNSHFDTHTLSLGGSWIRNNLNIVLGGEKCETHLNGLFILTHTEHVDNHTMVDHAMPHCESNQLYRGILDEKSVGVFNGKIFVRPDAQKTNAYQSSKNMLLSDDASINTKPQLEIYADDVKCSHGSSTGQINEDALFYLRARGLSLDSAKTLLMIAFAQDVVNTIRIDALRDYAGKLIEKRLTTA
jgi:Fe-S cluster assembly protein SufD